MDCIDFDNCTFINCDFSNSIIYNCRFVECTFINSDLSQQSIIVNINNILIFNNLPIYILGYNEQTYDKIILKYSELLIDIDKKLDIIDKWSDFIRKIRDTILINTIISNESNQNIKDIIEDTISNITTNKNNVPLVKPIMELE